MTAAPVAPPPTEERRGNPRFKSEQEASCRPVQQSTALPWTATIEDASLTGLRLHISRRFEAGTVLIIEVADANTAAVAQWLARVCWVREVGPNQWGVGCLFNRTLTEHELNQLLGGTSTVVTAPSSSANPQAH